MDSSALYRAAISAGVLVGVCVAFGGSSVPIATYGKAAAVQVAASLGSDKIHELVAMEPTSITSAVVCGTLYPAAQHFAMGDTNDTTNYVVSAGSEYGARTLESWGKVSESKDTSDMY